MNYYLYKITNLVNDRVYIGVHKTINITDGYMGSGKIIRQAIEKYGLSNFKKEILETFDNYDAMMLREKQMVDEKFLSNKNVYNLKLGGSGGWDYINENKLNQTEERKNKNSKRMKLWHKNNDFSGENGLFYGKNHTDESKKLISQKRKEFFSNGGEHPKGMLNKVHNEETKKHVSEIMKIKSSLIGKTGLEHPTGGTKWYNNGVKHLRSDVHPGGDWLEGRIFKKRNRN
jgi:group I intron endonuclease